MYAKMAQWFERSAPSQSPGFNSMLGRLIAGASRRLRPVIKYSLFRSFFQRLVDRASLSAVTKSLS